MPINNYMNFSQPMQGLSHLGFMAVRFVLVYNCNAPFFINNPFFTLTPKIVEAFLKNHPKKLFSVCLVDGPLTSFLNIRTF